MHADLRAALLGRDFERVGQLAEASALAMHASAIAAGVVYWTGATLEALAAVGALRAARADVYATIDPRPPRKVLVPPDQAGAAREPPPSVAALLPLLERP